MRSENSKVVPPESPSRDFVFTWKPEHWSHDELRERIDAFQSRGRTGEPWRCSAHKKVRPGDRAYLLEQGKRVGIFGRGTIVGRPEKLLDPSAGKNPWQVLIGFDVSRNDILWDPDEQFLVDKSQLFRLPVRKKQWQHQASGITLDSKAARMIDSAILGSILIGPGKASLADLTAQEVARRNKLIEQWVRPGQQTFSETVRKMYRDACAITGCVTRAALDAAHIGTAKGLDDNSPSNGILLRSDVHALFDAFLITFTSDGKRVEVSPELIDPIYATLNGCVVARPSGGPAPSPKCIQQHRSRFLERLRRNVVSASK